MADPRQFVLSTAALLAGPPMFVSGFKDLRMKQLIDNTPTSRIRSMAMGLVEVNGMVEGRSIANAPFSGRPCAYWQVEIATRTSRRGGWRRVHSETSGQPFFLRDETGVAMVYPRDSTCKLQVTAEEECHGLTLPEPYVSYIAKCGHPARHLWRLGSLRFRERVLEVGQRVYLLGTAVPKSRAHVVSGAEELAATGTDGDPWTRKLRDTSEQAVAVIRRGDAYPLLVISQTPERQLAFMLGIQAGAKLIGGPVLTLGGLAFLLDALKWMEWLH